MNRKNTILIAVAINAGLLAVLLIAALTTQDETAVPSSFVGDAPHKLDENPLFGESVDLALRQPEASKQREAEAPIPIQIPQLERATEEVPLAQIPVSSLEPAEQVVHKLPPLVPEAPPVQQVAVAPTPAPAPVATGPSFVEVVVKKGDSLEKIAKQYRTSVDEIIKINRLPSSFLRIGQVLKIPAEKTLSALPKPKQGVEKRTEGGAEYYTVKVGDNPWTIAMKHHIKVEELLRLNGLNEERARKLKVGDRLRTK